MYCFTKNLDKADSLLIGCFLIQCKQTGAYEIGIKTDTTTREIFDDLKKSAESRIKTSLEIHMKSSFADGDEMIKIHKDFRRILERKGFNLNYDNEPFILERGDLRDEVPDCLAFKLGLSRTKRAQLPPLSMNEKDYKGGISYLTQ